MTDKRFDNDRHKAVLTGILVDIAKQAGGKIAFKGGTAAMIFYGLPRLSLDLDFDILEEFAETETDELKIILRKHGTVKEARDKRFTLFFLLDYEKNYPNIKVEFNKRVWRNNAYTAVRLLGVEIKIADKATIFTNKLVALTDRRTPVARDLFDVHYFLMSDYPASEALIRERTGKDGRAYAEYLKRYIRQNYDKKNVLQGLGEVLDGPQKSWARDHLIDETISALDKLVLNES